jgi:hypothetical protein
MAAINNDPALVSAVAAGQAMGKGGSAFFDSSVPYTMAADAFPMASAFLCVTDVVFSVLTGAPSTWRTGGAAAGTNRPTFYANAIAIAGITFPAGLYVPGSFVAATITSGTVLISF